MKIQFLSGLIWARRSAPALAFTLIVSAVSASGATLYVTKSGSNNASCGSTEAAACLTIQYTISNRASAGDLIQVGPGIYSELVTINKNLTLSGPFLSLAILDGGGSGTVVTNTATATLERLIIRHGSGVASEQGQVAPSTAGGINNMGALTVLETLVTGNSASGFNGDPSPVAGGIANTGALTVESSLILSNSASGGCSTAGGIVNSPGSMGIVNSLIAMNTVSGGGCLGPGSPALGGGIFNGLGGEGEASVSTSTIWQNSISSIGRFTLSQSTVEDTSITNYSYFTVVNSTLYQSTLSNSVGELNGFLDMSNSTVWNNSTPGISEGEPLSSTIRNSILAGNPGGDCGGEFISGDYNIVQDTTGCVLMGGAHDLMGVSPDLGPLRFNGGATQTMYLLSGSPAINGGNPAGCKDSFGNLLTVDQRGFPRPWPRGGRCDIGAVEDQPFFWF